MFWTVNKTAEFLGVEPHQVYYLLLMGYVEAVKIGNAWRIVPEAAQAYAEAKFPNTNTSTLLNFSEYQTVKKYPHSNEIRMGRSDLFPKNVD